MPKVRDNRTAYEIYCDKWRAGCGNVICETAHRVCLARGRVPCDILFLGEAPGKSENVLGRPFVGPAGILLDQIAERSVGNENILRVKDGREPLYCAFTNLVGCIPLGDDGKKITEPEHDEIKRCAGRLQEFVALAAPRLIVTVGGLAHKYLDKVLPHREQPHVEIVHPAAVLRLNVAQQSLAIRKCVVTIANAIVDL